MSSYPRYLNRRVTADDVEAQQKARFDGLCLAGEPWHQPRSLPHAARNARFRASVLALCLPETLPSAEIHMKWA